MLNYIKRKDSPRIYQYKKYVTWVKNKLPIGPTGKNTEREKNPFQSAINSKKEVKPHIGQIAMSKEMTETTPTTAPIGINFGLYYSIDLILNQ